MPYNYNTDTGLIVPDTAEIYTEVENEFTTAFGSDLDLSSSTPQGRLIEMEALARQGTVGLCALIANQINIDYATGQYLDAIGAFFNVARKGATSTSVLATVAGVAGTIIPAGSLVQTQAGDDFYLENETIIPEQGFTTAYFLSVEQGDIPCATGTLTIIIDQTIGWETVNNPVAAIIGSNQESDYDYRKRIKSARYVGISYIQAIKAQLEQVENLKSSFVYDNVEDDPVVYDTITIPAHSIVVVADGGADEDVAQAIFSKKSAGSGYTAIPNQSVTVEVADGAYGVEYPVTFNRPEVLQFEINIQVRNNNYTGADLETAVQNAILTWANGDVESVDGLKIGQDVSPFEIASAVSEQLPSIYVKSCLICAVGGTPSAEELSCTNAQIYAIEVNNINVEIVG